MKALTILVFNCGSSSLKFGYYLMESSFFNDSTSHKSQSETTLNQSPMPETFQLKPLLSGEMVLATQDEKKHQAQFVVNNATMQLHSEALPISKHVEAAQHIVQYLAGFSTPKPSVIAHRIVHGGPHLLQHCLINDKVMRQLDAAAAFAPLHHQATFDVINYARAVFTALPQVACFDTAFHTQMPEVAKQLPIGKKWRQEGVYRYGFHGISCESIVQQLGNLLPRKLIIAHLGGGCSITALEYGVSIDNSMGLTPSGGAMMGTRSGDIDPGVLIYLMRAKNYGLASLDHLVNHQSGLLGVSALSGNMQILREAAANDTQAQLAIDMFCYSISKQIAGMVAVLNGLDCLIFTGGIGENDAITRAAICEKLSFMGLSINASQNQTKQPNTHINAIHTTASRVNVLVMQSNENDQIARQAWSLLTH